MPPTDFRYAGFWVRLGALLIDLLCISPTIPLVRWGWEHYRLFDLYWLGPSIGISLLFHVYVVGRFGGTPGKLLLGLRIARVDGGAIGYTRALVREAPGLGLDIIYLAGVVVSVLSLTDAQYGALNHRHHYTEVEKFAPPWVHWTSIATQVWIWSEFLVMLTNRRRRALHDFLAGTVVVHRSPAPPVEPEPAQSAST
jgi:uncharacterized RDD family membrane protein YckC